MTMLLLKAVVHAHERHGPHGLVHVDAYTTRTAAAHHATPAIVSFHSGASSPNIMRGYIVSHTPFGVSLGEMSAEGAGWDMMIEYARRGGMVFVDSGAFTAFTKGQTVDWPRVMGLYARLAREAPGTRFHLVAPDVIGDQDASMALLAAYRDQIRALIGQGHDMLVPVQKGALSPYSAWRNICDLLGTDDFTASVPSNKQAFSPADLADLMGGEHKPHRIHLLGIAGNKKRLAELAAVIHSRSPRTFVTTDANRLRAQVGQGRPITEARRQSINWLRDAFASLIEDPARRAIFLSQGHDVVSGAAQAMAISKVEARGREQKDLFT